MKILIVTQLFDPENAIKGLGFTKALVDKGHELVVLTTFPSYPGGKIYPGFKMSLIKIEKYEGIKVVRLPCYISHDTSIIKRFLNYGTFGLSTLIYGLFFVGRTNIIYAYHPALVAGYCSWILGIFKSAPFIYDVQDLWPDALTDSGILNNSRAVGFIGKLANFLYTKSTRIVVLSEGYKRLLMERGVPAEKITHVYNWCDESRMKAIHKAPESHQIDSSYFNILYAGNFGAAQGLSSILDAAKVTFKINKKIRFLLLGDGVEYTQLVNKISNEGIINVIILPKVSVDFVGSISRQADALLIHLKESPVYSVTIPSKTQACMALGMPILMAVNGEAADLVRRAGAGVFAKPCDANKIAAAAVYLAEMQPAERQAMGIRARAYYVENLAMSIGVEKTNTMLNEIFTGHCDV